MKTSNRFALLMRIVLIGGLAANAVLAQSTGRLSGSVADPSGAMIAGATVGLMLPGGAQPIITAVTNADGLFSMIGVPAGTYLLAVTVKGYKKHVEEAVTVRPGQELALGGIKLEIGQVSETVQVTETQGVQTSNAEVSQSFTRQQIKDLPLIGRSPQAFVGTQAGVTQAGGANASIINGQRTSFTSVTLDGINIQDNFIRTNAVDFSPNVLLLDQVAEFTVSTSNTNATASGGASQVAFVTPSGTNTYHGSAYWQNRNNAFAANTWFNNQSNVPRPFLNSNWIGGGLGGPVIKDKLLFYGNFEAFRQRQQAPANRTILTANARQGIFTYRDGAGNVQQVDVLKAAGVQADPAAQAVLQQVPGPDKINNFRVGDSSDALLRNTAGFSFNIGQNRSQDHYTARVDYNLSPKNTFSGTWIYNTDNIDRPDISNDFTTAPKVTNVDNSKFLSVGWRWNLTPAFTNELRGGFNIAPVLFLSSENFGDAIIEMAGGANNRFFSNPVNTFRTSNRFTNTYALNDNAAYIRGKHIFQFGFQSQRVSIRVYSENGITPAITLGMGTGNLGGGLTNAQLPGANATDVAAANNLLASLAGFFTTSTQTFNVTDRTSDFVKGAANERNWELNNYAGYLADSWKVRPRLSLTLGLRYDYYSPIKEQNGLSLSPLLTGNPLATLRSNATLDFASGSDGRPLYNSDRNNFAPNIGLAWDVFGDGKTAVRAGYSINYVNDELMAVVTNNINGNSGLVQGVSAAGLTGRVGAGLPVINPPTLKVPRTFEDNFALSTNFSPTLIDPNLQNPYVQQWCLEVRGIPALGQDKAGDAAAFETFAVKSLLGGGECSGFEDPLAGHFHLPKI